MAHRITLIPGDGIGPEVSAATQDVLRAAGVEIDWDVQTAGLEVARLTGTPLPIAVLASIRQHRVALKGPCGTPIGGGFKSINVTLRQTLDLYANVRPIKSLPKVDPRFDVDMVIVRENTEGLYAGLELMILPGIAQSIKLTTERCSTRIAEFAFDYAKRHGRARVTIAHKANILKVSDGLALEATRAVGKRHPEIELREMIVDATAMTMVRDPNSLGVVVTENLYGDILSDLGAGLVGGLGFVAGANIGDDCAVFEAVHGTAPDIAGKGIANPTALIASAVMMLDHIGESAAADRIGRALIRQYEERKVLTGEIGGTATTKEFSAELCRLVAGL
ncbi:MAG: isocitrate/isopropylmalate dehydrogenase family protein [Myxococcales bacterium]|nr:isocitrate/isopropylmalate dehydrogenase family protein [Myxococcales bacterium]